MSNTKKNLGHVTAYAYYKAGGGTMTEEEFTEYMADFGDAAERAVDAASEAAQSKADAQTAATTATDKADEAAASASSASGSAASAAEDASTASTAANTATGAATTATNAKNDAVSAKNAAVSAKTAAETAAGTATTKATAAANSATAAANSATAAAGSATEAATTAQGISEHLDQIDENTDAIEGLKEDLSESISSLAYDNRILVSNLVFTNGYWNTSGVLVDSTTTFHTDKISVIPNRQYYVEFPATTTKVIMRNFNTDGTVAGSYERTSSGIFTPTTGIIAFNAIGSAKTDTIYFLDTETNLVLKDNTVTSRGIVSSGTVALSDYTEPGWYVFYSAVNVTDRPSLFYQGGFILFVLKTDSIVYQIVFPYDWQRWAYRVLGHNWVQPFRPNYYQAETISIIGDSLSDKANSTAATRYYDIVDKQLGTVSTEYAMSGCGYKRKYNNGKAFYEQALDISPTTDLVLIFGSFNDHNVYDTDGLGAVTDTTTDTVFGCVYTTLQNIFATAPKALVGIILPTPWAQYPPYDTDTLQWDYVNGIKEIAKRYSIPVLDLYSESNMRPWDATFRTNFYNENGVQDSGTHPSSAGHARFAPKVVEFVKSILQQIDRSSNE